MLYRISVIFLSFLSCLLLLSIKSEPISEHCLEKTLCFRQNIYYYFLTQNDKNITNFPNHVTKLPFPCLL